MTKRNPIIAIGIAIFTFLAVIAGIFITKNSGPYINPSTSGQSPIPAQVSQNSIEIMNMAFTPQTIKVKTGTTVTWTNKDGVGHTATATDGTFDTGLISNGKSATVTFTKSGTYNYYCSIHPYMKGVVIVE